MGWPEELLAPPGKRRVVWDIETNGLLVSKDGLPPMDRIHCATIEDIDSGEHFEWTPDDIHRMPEFMMDEVEVVIGHNIIDFDTRATKLIYPKFNIEQFKLFDTLTLCKLLWPADVLIGPDMQRWRTGKLPPKYIKRQSLGAWGYRLGNYKGEYDGGWDKWSQEMQDYMVQDGKVNLDLLKLILKRLGWDDESPPKDGFVWPYLPIWIETEAKKILAEQEAIGVHFDGEAAVKLLADLQNMQAEMTAELQRIFGSWWAPLDDPHKGRTPSKDRTRVCKEFPNVTIKRYGKKGQELKPYIGPPKEYYFAGAPYCRIEWTTFNPKSRQHLADRLRRVFGWQPTEFTPSGQAQVDEGSIKNIPDSVIDKATRKTLMDFFVVTKTLGQLHDGNKSWMHFVQEDGAIHGVVDPLGTISTRGAHYNPNLGQVPSVEVEEIKDDTGKVVDKKIVYGIEGGFGFECRSLFSARKAWLLSGTDCSSLEFIWLGHYLHPLDEGVFSERVCDPERDPHAEHSDLTGLPRRDTKTVGYAYIFGAGAPKIGSQVGYSEEEMPELLKSKSLSGRLRFMRKVKGSSYEEPDDRTKAQIAKGFLVIRKFEGAITGLKFLKEDITQRAETQGWLKGIDGRKLIVRKPHAGLNTILQGAGAISCKLWMILVHQKLRALGYKPREDYNQVLWIHDELQIEHRPELKDIIAKVSDEAVKEAGRMLGLRGELRTDTKCGRNWAETH